MSDATLEKMFSDHIESLDTFVTLWDTIAEQLPDLLGENRVNDTAELEKIGVEIHGASEKFREQLAHPRITIATTGTTSGGKSTIVNLFCGAEIMPVDAGEMSAGIVTIDHHSEHRSLRILETPGALWTCGEWCNLTDNDIRKQLKEVMDAYNAVRDTVKQPDSPPVIEIEYPTSIGRTPQEFGLPSGFTLRIMDLPGLKYSGDHGSANVIRNSRDALCVLTFNAEETDPRKQEELLKQVVQQIKELGGSPARMLVVFNRIDAFRRDLNWPDNENKYVETWSEKIRSTMTEVLVEHTDDIVKMQMLRLSSMPALHAKLMNERTGEEQINAGERLLPYFPLLPKDVKNDLHCNPTKWIEQDFRRVYEGIWHASYADDLYTYLRKHIQKNIPELLLPPIMREFRDSVTPSVDWLGSIVVAELNSSEEKYSNECERLEELGDSRQRVYPPSVILNEVKDLLLNQAEADPSLRSG